VKRIIVRDARIADLAAICPPEHFHRYRPLLEHVADAFIAEDGELVCIAGLTFANPKTAEAWNLPGPRFGEYLAAPRAIRERIVHYAHTLALVRIQSTVLDGVSYRFDYWLGFREEARLADFGPNGEEAIIMRWRGTWQ
jgi:hypothetical protein